MMTMCNGTIKTTSLVKKKKTATWIVHKIRTLFLSWDIEKTSLIALRCSDARSRGQPRHRANLVILRDKNSVLILCIIQVAVFFLFLARVVVAINSMWNYPGLQKHGFQLSIRTSRLFQ